MEKADRVVKALDERGFILELNVFRKLKSCNWSANLSFPFWNVELDLTNESVGVGKNLCQRDREKTRLMDVYATRMSGLKEKQIGPLTVIMSFTTLVLECKKRTKENWIFYQETPFMKNLEKNMDHYSLGGMFLIDYLKRIGKMDRDDNTCLDILRTSHHSLGKIEKVATAGVPVFGPKNKDGFYDSCEQVISAYEYLVSLYQSYTNHYLTGKSSMNLNWRIYPIIVFDGPLWEVNLEKDEISVAPLKRVVYEHKKGDLTHLIDIVSWDFFDDYCEVLEKEVHSLSKL